MGKVIRFPGRHGCAPAGSRAAKRAKRSEVIPFASAFSVARTRVHHSDGMLSRFHHLITAQLPAPTSEAIASRESQSSMIERNESKSGMHESMGLTVPKIKAVLSHDTVSREGHSVPMSESTEDITETEWREGFRQRLIMARKPRTQETMARLLGISRDQYSKYELKDQPRMMSPRLLPKFADICGVDLRDLIEGPAEPAKVARRQ